MQNKNIEISTQGWYRFSEILLNQYLSDLVYGMNGIIKINTNFNETTNTAFMLAVSGSYKKASFSVMSECNNGNTKIINKIRCIKKNDNIYFDAFYCYNSTNRLYYNTNCYVQSTLQAIYSKDYDIAYSVDENDYDAVLGFIQL